MSNKSYASASVRSSGGGSVRLGATGAAAAAAASAHEVVLDALYERKRDKKTVRVLTVIVYVFCVSLAAIMLSLYYVFFWEPKDAQYAQRKVLHNVERQTGTTPMPTCFMPHTGGGDSAVDALVDPSPVPDNITQTPSLGHEASLDIVQVTTDTVEPMNATYPSDEDFNGTASSVT